MSSDATSLRVNLITNDHVMHLILIIVSELEMYFAVVSDTERQQMRQWKYSPAADLTETYG